MLNLKTNHDEKAEVRSSDICFEKLEKLLSDGFPKVEAAKNKEVVLVIGNTGSGKSTTINYLMGCNMREEEINGFFVIETENKAYAKIGHTSASETLYPEVYTIHENFDDLSYCDCPGFGDTRGKEEQICISINTQLAVKFSKRVQAVMVVIDYNEMRTGRGEGFKRLSSILGHLFKNPDEIAESIVFVITKVDSRITKNHIIATVSSLIKTEEQSNSAFLEGFKNVFSIGKSPSKEDRKKAENFANKMKILQLMNKYSQNIEVVDVLDGGNSKTRIIEHLQGNVPILLEAFDFGRYDEARVKFDRIIFKIAHEGAKVIQIKVDLPSCIRDCEYKILDAEERIKFYQEQISRVGNPEKLLIETQETRLRQIKILQNRYENNEELIKNDKINVNQLKKESFNLSEELRQLDSDELILYWTREYKKKGSFFSRLTFFIFDLGPKFEYSDVPFEKVEIFKSEGKLKVITESPKEGKYLAEWHFLKITQKEELNDDNESNLEENKGKSKFVNDLFVSVKIYVQTRNKPDNNKRIEDIKKILENKNSEICGLESNINKLSEENRLHIEMISNLDSTGKQNERQIKQQIQNFEMGIREFSEKIEHLRKDKEASQQRLLEAEKEVEIKQNQFEMIRKISSTMEYASPLIKEFLHQLDRLHHQKSLNLKFGKKVPEDFICPIKLDILDDPVIAQCSHTFDRMEIINYFRMRSSNIIECPCCREPIQENSLINNAKLKLVIDNWKKENGLIKKIFVQSIDEQEAPRDVLLTSLKDRKKSLEEKMDCLKLNLAKCKIEHKEVLDGIQKLEGLINPIQNAERVPVPIFSQQGRMFNSAIPLTSVEATIREHIIENDEGARLGFGSISNDFYQT